MKRIDDGFFHHVLEPRAMADNAKTDVIKSYFSVAVVHVSIKGKFRLFAFIAHFWPSYNNPLLTVGVRASLEIYLSRRGKRDMDN